jgi:hypothetical protein
LPCVSIHHNFNRRIDWSANERMATHEEFGKSWM